MVFGGMYWGMKESSTFHAGFMVVLASKVTIMPMMDREIPWAVTTRRVALVSDVLMMRNSRPWSEGSFRGR